MSKKCAFRRRHIDKNYKWRPLDTGTEQEKLALAKENGFVSYYKIPQYWTKEGRYNYFCVNDKIYEWIEKNYNKIKVVYPTRIKRGPQSVWVQMQSEHDVSSMSDSEKDSSFSGLYILFKDVKDVAKFKLIMA